MIRQQGFRALAVVWLSAAALAAEFTVGVEDIDYFPIFSVSGPEQRYVGYARDVLDRFAAQHGHRFVYRPLPVKRLYREYWQGRFDLVFPDSPRWNSDTKRQQGLELHYSAPLLVFQNVILVKPERLGRGRESVQVLGVIRGFTPWKFQDDITAGRIRVEEAQGARELLKMAMLDRVDAVDMAWQVANHHLRALKAEGALVPDPGLLDIQDSHYYLSSRRHPELIRQFDQFLSRNANEIAALRRRYGL
ncbi:substrate-binding periplasmic protein [Chitinimonas lacunae]|uniref:Substrate-binding periplasmic protein n=1 Tax=Chitinimonas lacunae TaxID=1963018 RepID=A0ABV8MMJ7_9NEIS